jgi:uncharacterized membrane protein required for colicin V production
MGVLLLSILIAATVGNRYAPELLPQLSVWVRGYGVGYYGGLLAARAYLDNYAR